MLADWTWPVGHSPSEDPSRIERPTIKGLSMFKSGMGHFCLFSVCAATCSTCCATALDGHDMSYINK